MSMSSVLWCTVQVLDSSEPLVTLPVTSTSGSDSPSPGQMADAVMPEDREIRTDTRKTSIGRDKMLFRNVGRALRSTLRVDKRFLASEPIKPQSDIQEGVEPLQNEALDKDICLLVDEKDNMIGTATKRDCHKVGPDGNVLLHRAFSVFFFNKRGDMLLQRRSSQKVTYPDYYTNACCSHPLYIDEKPEDVITAARRRLNHELGIPLDQLDPEQFVFMTRVHYHDPGDGVWGEHEIDHILFLQSDVKVKPNSNEISEYCFVPKAEFNAFIPTLEGPITPWFNMIRRHRLKLWWDNLHRLKELAEPEKIHKFANEK